MQSLRKPKTITIRGNDGNEYVFLVKAGEDLRQDQRIQQLFTQMNAVLSADPESRRRELGIRTYSVIPITSKSVLSLTSLSLPVSTVMTEVKPQWGYRKIFCRRWGLYTSGLYTKNFIRNAFLYIKGCLWVVRGQKPKIAKKFHFAFAAKNGVIH